MAENQKKLSSEHAAPAIRSQTQGKFSADEKIRTVIDGLRGKDK